MTLFSKPIRRAFKAAHGISPIAGRALGEKGIYYSLPKTKEVFFDLEGRVAYAVEPRTWDDGSHSMNLCLTPQAPLPVLRSQYRKAAKSIKRLLGDSGTITDRIFGETLVRFSLKCDAAGTLVGSDKDTTFVTVEGAVIRHDELAPGDTVRVRVGCGAAFHYTDKGGDDQFKLMLRVKRVTKLRGGEAEEIELSDSSSGEDTGEDEMKSPEQAAVGKKKKAPGAPAKKPATKKAKATTESA